MNLTKHPGKFTEIVEKEYSDLIKKQIENKEFNFKSNQSTFSKMVNYPREKLKKYNERFKGKGIVTLALANCPPETANEYDQRFDSGNILTLLEKGCPPEIANKYDKRFSGDESTLLWLSNCPPEKAIKYDKHYNGIDIATIIESNCPPEIANKYNKKFKGWEVGRLFPKKCLPQIANQYDKRFKGYEIAWLFEENCPPEIANKYPKEIHCKNIILCYKIGLNSKKISKSIRKILSNHKIFLSLDASFKALSFSEEGKEEIPQLLGVGATGIVFLKTNNAWKFSPTINKEYTLLKKICDYHKNNQNNIIKLIDKKLKENLILEIEHIYGDSLENIIKQKKKLNYNEVLNYGSGIINGLIEMRQAGIFYHRDIRPANILIDEENDKAVIIDFGIATTNRQALPKDNRRYGGVNDLISLGQIMYKMATGEHIFTESESMEKTIYAKKIKDYRDIVYSDKTRILLTENLKKVDENIRDKRLNILIKACLTAKNCHYKKIKRMFEEFSN